jgi:hypothetical protein
MLSLVSGLIGYLLKEYFAAGGKLVFFGYPRIAGRWKSTYPEEPDYAGEYLEFKQFGPHITGELNAFERHMKYRLEGHVAPERILQFQYRPKDNRFTKYGTALLKLNFDLTEADGYLSFLPDDEPPATIKIHLTRE